MNQHRVFSNEPQTATHRPSTVKHRGRVYKYACAFELTSLGLNAFQKHSHLALQHVMIVGTVCIFGDFEMLAIAYLLLWEIIVKYGDNGLCAFN